MRTLGETLAGKTREGELYLRGDGTSVRCIACGHRCPIPDGALGVCKVRFNEGGRLMVPWGYVAGAQCDPIEKKPFFHVRPGALAYSFGMLGCDMHCGYCQNWITSQALRDPSAGAVVKFTQPADLVTEAVQAGATAFVRLYNEPLISVEWAVEVFRAARRAGLLTGFVSNGNGTPEVLEYLAPWIDMFKIDLKGFDDRRYRQLGGRLQPVLDTIAGLHELGVWTEVVTLLVPGFNDDVHEIEQLTQFLAGVSPDIPWHVTAFHADYHMRDTNDTTADMLVQASAIGRDQGLRFVYAGNVPGRVGSLEDTHCPACGCTLIERHGYRIGAYRLSSTGTCLACNAAVPGRWSRSFDGQISATPRVPGWFPHR